MAYVVVLARTGVDEDDEEDDDFLVAVAVLALPAVGGSGGFLLGGGTDDDVCFGVMIGKNECLQTIASWLVGWFDEQSSAQCDRKPGRV